MYIQDIPIQNQVQSCMCNTPSEMPHVILLFPKFQNIKL